MFQDRFGVAHLLGSKEQVVSYIKREVAEIDSDSEVSSYTEQCGWRGNYMRVDLRAIRDGVISVEELADGFIRSSDYGITIDSVALTDWSNEWHTIMQICRSELTSIDGFERDSVELAKLLSAHKYVVHHSRKYNECYAPHYRIVHRRVADELLR